MARGASARFGLDKICGVTVDTEARVASVELDDGVWLHDCVVHKYLCVLDGVGGGRSFLSANFIECDNHCVVDSVIDVEKVPAMICTRMMPHLSSLGAFVASGEYFTLSPYVGASHLLGEC